MLQLQPVSKYKKEKWANMRQTKIELFKETQYNLKSNSEDDEISPDQPFITTDIPYQERFFENSNLTQFIHQKIISIKLSMMVLAFLSIALSLLKDELAINSTIERYILILHTLDTAALITMAILQHLMKKQLKHKQLIKISIKKQWQITKKLCMEIIILLIHPNLLTKSMVIYIPEPSRGLITGKSVNDIVEIIMLLRVYLILKALVSISKYCSTRASRICRMYSIKTNHIFGIKSIFNSNPLLFLFSLFIIVLITYSQMLKISQKDINADLNNLGNSLWCIVITMGTIGYNDYRPITYLGRIIAFCSALSGIIMTSLLILTLSRYLAMTVSQNKSHITLERLQLRQKLQKYSQETILQTTSMLKINPKTNTPAFLEQLKKKTQKVKATMRTIKNMVDNDNLNEEMSRLFEMLTDNLKQIFINQLDYSKLLIKIYQTQRNNIQNIKFSFTKQIEDIIKDQ